MDWRSYFCPAQNLSKQLFMKRLNILLVLACLFGLVIDANAQRSRKNEGDDAERDAPGGNSGSPGGVGNDEEVRGRRCAAEAG